jgi:hypothetical protein
VPDISPKPRLGVTSIEGEQHSISLRRLSLPFSLHIPVPHMASLPRWVL